MALRLSRPITPATELGAIELSYRNRHGIEYSTTQCYSHKSWSLMPKGDSAHFDEWGPFRFTAYKLTRVAKRRNWKIREDVRKHYTFG